MDNSHLSRLPAELRNRIYELLFEDEKTFKVSEIAGIGHYAVPERNT